MQSIYFMKALTKGFLISLAAIGVRKDIIKNSCFLSGIARKGGWGFAHVWQCPKENDLSSLRRQFCNFHYGGGDEDAQGI